MKSYSDDIPSAKTTEETNKLVKENLAAIKNVEYKTKSNTALLVFTLIFSVVSVIASVASIVLQLS